MNRRLALTALLALAAGAAAAPGTWKGTITMYAQEYTPNKPNAKRKLQELRRVADEYEKRYPGIKIQFVTDDIADTNGTIRAKAAAGELWDVFWAQYSDLNSGLPQGIAVNLAPYFAQKNSYAPQYRTWRDAMNKTIIAETAAPGGASYQINGDFVATAFYYNRDLFKKAGITQEPRSWTQLLAAARKLKAAGIPAEVGVPYYPWWQRHFLSDFYAKDYARIAGYDKQPGISGLDQAVAVKKGLLSPRDPRFMAWWPEFKKFTDTWVPDYIALNPDKNTQAFQDFLGGKAAMMYEGSWTPNKIKDAGVSGSYGSFNFPVIGKTVTRYSTGANTANAVGGPGAAYQYAISTPQANHTMRERGKFEATLDWLRYIGTPGINQRVVNEQGDFVPTFNGARARTENEALVSQAKLQLRSIGIGGAVAPNVPDDMQRIFGLYLSGNLGLDQARTQVQQLLDRAADEYGRKNDVDFSKY